MTPASSEPSASRSTFGGPWSSAGVPSAPEGRPRCSARGCRRDGVHELRWNNPSLHSPDRRKTWLACDEHLESLSAFLSMRGFLRETVPLGS